MDATRRTLPLRRVATMASLALLLIPAGQADAAKHRHTKRKVKLPVITKVSPMKATVGDELTIHGRHFRKGKGRNSVGFKRDGAAVVFVKAGVSTKKVMVVKLRKRLEKVLYGGTPATFQLRVLAKRFGKRYTRAKRSLLISPRPAKPGGDGGDPAGPLGDCDGDGKLNKNEGGDIDGDLLSDGLENKIGTNGCNDDSDGDGVTDAYEYKSAIDLNDDEYQNPNTVLPYPGKRPYPNPLDGGDAGRDHDGDSLTLAEEFALWSKQGGIDKTPTPQAFADTPMTYSDGLQYSKYEYCPSASHPGACGPGDANRRVPALAAAAYAKQADFLGWAASAGYGTVRLQVTAPSWNYANGSADFDVRDVNRDGAVSTGCHSEALYYDYDCDGYLSDDERDEDADGLTNYDESHGRATPGYWVACYGEPAYPNPYEGTDLADGDTDGDGVRDGADDQDHDDVPNLMELSRIDASGFDDTDDGDPGSLSGGGPKCTLDPDIDPEAPHQNDFGEVHPFDPCQPAKWARSCPRHPEFGIEPEPWYALQ